MATPEAGVGEDAAGEDNEGAKEEEEPIEEEPIPGTIVGKEGAETEKDMVGWGLEDKEGGDEAGMTRGKLWLSSERKNKKISPASRSNNRPNSGRLAEGKVF